MQKTHLIKILLITFLFLLNCPAAQEISPQVTTGETQVLESSEPKIIETQSNYPDKTQGNNSITGVDTGLTGTIPAKIEAKNKKLLTANDNENLNSYAKVTLIDVILETVSNNYNVKVAREKVLQAKLDLDDGYAGYKPTLDAEYKYGTTRLTPSDNGVDTATNRFHDETFKLKLRQNLYAGGATSNKIKSLEKSLEVAKNRYELAISQEIQNAIKAYFGVVFSYQSLYVTRINMDMLQKILEIVTTKYDLGAASIGDISSIKASVSNAESKLSKTNSKFVEALKYYEYIAGENFKYTLPYEYEFKIKLAPLEELLKISNEKNLNIVSYLTTIESEKYKLKAAQAAFLPKVDLEFTNTEIYNKDIAPVDFYQQNKREAFVTVQYNLYNGDKDNNKVLSIYSTIRETKYKIEEERRKLKWIISNLHQSLNALDSSISSTRQEVESSQVTVESYWEAFKNGEQDLQTLLTAQRQLNTAQVSLIEFYQNRLNDYYKLIFETGELVSYFDLDPTKDNFIDFTKSKYNKNSMKNKEKNDLMEFASIFKTPKVEESKSSDGTKVVDTIEDIMVFKDKFLDANDDYFTLYIGEFDTIYDTFGFIKNNALSKQAFMIDILNDYKLKNIMAYGIYETQEQADTVLNEMQKVENKEYKVVSIKMIKDLYKDFIDGFDELRPKEIVETTTITMAPKPPKPYFTNEEFKQKFMASKADNYTINLVTFAKLDDAIALVNNENIADNSLMFRYGTNAEWIKVVYGVFESYEEATSALAKLSYDMKEKYFPVIEFIKDKQALYEKYKNLQLGVPLIYKSKVEYEKISENTKRELKESSGNQKRKKALKVQEKSAEKTATQPVTSAPTEVDFKEVKPIISAPKNGPLKEELKDIPKEVKEKKEEQSSLLKGKFLKVPSFSFNEKKFLKVLSKQLSKTEEES